MTSSKAKRSVCSPVATDSTPPVSILGFRMYQEHALYGKLYRFTSKITLLTSPSRYDLRPATTNDSNTVATSAGEPLPSPPSYEVSDNAPGRSRFRELRRAHAGHEEYVAALRQLYHELENHLASHASTR